MRAIAATLLAMGVLAAARPAAASTLSVAPIRVELSSATRTAVITVRNQEDAAVVVQARPASWSQHEMQDQLDDTRDLLVTPPLFTVPPKGQQVLRIALLREPDPGRELDYRLVLSEGPSPTATESTGLRVALRITLPVFVSPVARAAPELAWSHSLLPDGTLEVAAHNRGSAHIQILDFEVQDAEKSEHAGAPLRTEGARYLLPGSSAQWQLHPGAGQPPRAAGALIIKGHSDAGDFTVTSSPGAPQ
ncbi:MAG TPA: fimbria/pilus periplasmic chaperone [Steroidobacteraceae bacterium]|nr:fimbria/pilus periplasmic chaperone [Steroidobacteraceae bacterium]